MTDTEIVEKLMTAAKTVGYGGIPPYEYNECFITGAFDLIVPNCSECGRNFRLLEAICRRYDDAKNDVKFLSGYLDLLAKWVRATDTTELPVGMRRILEENPNTTLELQEWYRLKG